MTPDREDDDALVEYYLRGDGADGGDDRSNRRGALIGLAVVVVLVTVAITLTAVFVDTSSAARGPRAVALQWGQALVHGDTAARRRLECARGSQEADVVRSALAGTTGVSTDDAHRIGRDRWSVPLEFGAADSGLQDAVDVTVVREAGHYRVC